jgi:hypothetical protein
VEEGLLKHQTLSLYAPPHPTPRNSLKMMRIYLSISRKIVDVAFRIVICVLYQFIQCYTNVDVEFDS